MANYSGTIIATGLAQSKKQGTPSVKLQIKTAVDLDTGAPADHVFYADLWLSEKAAERSMATLRELGYNADTLDALNGRNELIDAPCEISTEWETYEGKETEKVHFVNRAGSYAERGIKPLGKAETSAICNRYDALLRATAKRKAQGAPAAPSRSSGPAPVPPPQAGDYYQPSNDDGLPF